MPSGLPAIRPFTALSFAKLILLGLIAVIEVLSQIVRIVSLSFRLFFNLLAGHLVIAVFLGLASLLGTYFILPVGIPMGIALYLLECTLIAGLQAFIFATLSAIYIGGAIHPDH
jgi:F-type H+-transporting ATPase subunit a